MAIVAKDLIRVPGHFFSRELSNNKSLSIISFKAPGEIAPNSLSALLVMYVPETMALLGIHP
jgi:hypothetical protein